MESENERQSSISFAGEEKEKRARGSTLLHFMCQVFRGWQELVFFLMYTFLALFVGHTDMLNDCFRCMEKCEWWKFI